MPGWRLARGVYPFSQLFGFLGKESWMRTVNGILSEGLYLPGRASPPTSRKALESLRKMPLTKGRLFKWECQLMVQKGMGGRGRQEQRVARKRV